MAPESLVIDWQETQNEAYLRLLESRLAERKLTWVSQFVEIINGAIANKIFDGIDSISVADFGCNVGHFFRGIGDLSCGVSYHGFDISETYLSIARRTFGEEYFSCLDITSSVAGAQLSKSSISVISATLEHLVEFERAIENIFLNTTHLVILRTFVGAVSLAEQCKTNGAKTEYLIRQFTIDELVRIPLALGWHYTEEIDLATSGKTKLVCNSSSIPRAQTLLVFRRV